MEHKCPECNAELHISKSTLKSDEGSTDVFSELDMVCPNPNCKNYAGHDRTNPKVIVETIRAKVN